MEQNLITCSNCNGQGLVSTGADKLDLKRGNKVVCEACAGRGKVPDPAQDGVGEKADAEAKPEGDPKAQDQSQSAPGGDGSSDGSEGAELGPQIGSKCVLEDGTPGTLGKNEAGDWVCNPDAA